MASIKLLQLYRNSALVDTIEEAKSLMEQNKQGKDGEVLIARYKDSEGNPKALVGVYNAMSGETATLTYLEGVNINEETTVSAAVQAAIDEAVGAEESRAEQAESDLQDAITAEETRAKEAEEALQTALEEAIDALDYMDSATNGQFVTSVSETNGVISVTRGDLTSNGGTVVIDGYDLSVNIDGTTITADSDGKLSVASSALTQYVGEDAIAISDPDANNDKTVSLVIDESDKVLSQSTSGLKTTLTIDYNSEDHTVNLKGIDGAIVSSFDATEFIVDGMIQSAELVHENPNTGATGEFLAITFNTEGGQTTTIYIDVAELIDTYTAGNGLALDDHEFSVKIADSDEGYLQSTDAGIKTEGIGDAISSAVATETSRAETAESELQDAITAEETRAKEAEEELQAAIEEAQAAATTVVEKDSSASHLTVSSSTDSSTGATTYTIGESDIASASDLSSLQDEVTADETTINNIIASAGLNSNGTLTDVTLPGSATNLVDAITALESEIQSDETKLAISNTDGSIDVDTTSGSTVISVKFAEAADSNANDMISVTTDGIILSNEIDCGTYD